MIVKFYLLNLAFGFGAELPQNKKNPLDSEESRGNLMAEDEGFDEIKVLPPSRPAASNSPPDCCI